MGIRSAGKTILWGGSAPLTHEADMGSFNCFAGDLTAEDTFTLDVPAGNHDITLTITVVQDIGSPPTGTLLAAYTTSGPDIFSNSNGGSNTTATVGPDPYLFTGGTYTFVVHASGLTTPFFSGHFHYLLTVA